MTTRRANYRRAGLLRGRYGRMARWLGVLAVLVLGVAELRQSELFYPVIEPYDRTLYPHWIDADGNCRDTRAEVLVRESLVPPTLTDDGCRVVAGRWLDPFTGQWFDDPALLDIDHLVPLAEAHRSGADRWDVTRRRAFANDLTHPDTLLAVDRSANRAKADRDPLSWLPPAWDRRCAYVARWRDTKRRWDLAEDLLEGWWVDGVLWVCARIDR